MRASNGYKRIPDDGSPIPDIPEIRALLENEPRRILSFANRFFGDEDISADFRIEVAIRLNEIFQETTQGRFLESDKSCLWCGILRMAMYDAGSINLKLYEEAKRTLLEVPVESAEAEAIEHFLGDFYSLSSNEPGLLEKDFSKANECQLYVWLGLIANYCDSTRLSETVQRLEQFLQHDSYLIREQVVYGFSSLMSNHNLKDSDLQSCQSDFETALKQLENDSNPYVRQAVRSTIETAKEVFDKFLENDSP